MHIIFPKLNLFLASLGGFPLCQAEWMRHPVLTADGFSVVVPLPVHKQYFNARKNYFVYFGTTNFDQSSLSHLASKRQN